MIIEKRITLNNNTYFLCFEVKYSKKGFLCKKDNSYFDLGDLSIMISYAEEKYSSSKKYDKNIYYMNDIIYLYNLFPFISKIKEISFDNKNNIKEIASINRKEIIKYIKNNNIIINELEREKIPCPLLYK